MAYRVMADGVEIDWSGVDVMVDGQLAGAVYVNGEKVWPAEPPVTTSQSVYVTDAAAVIGGAANDVLSMSIEGPFDSPVGLGMTLAFPIYVAVAQDGTVYVYDSGGALGGTNALYKFDGTQSAVPIVGGVNAIAVGPDGAVYVLDQNAKKVYRYDGIQSEVPFTGLSDACYSVAVDANGIVYVADRGNKNVVAYGDAGQTTVGFTGLNSPSAVAVGPDDAIYVSDSGTTVYRYDGSAQTSISFTGTIGWIAVDDNGVIFAVDGATYALYRHDGTTQSTVFAGASAGHALTAVAVGPAQT